MEEVGNHEEDAREQSCFVDLLTKAQPRLHAYILCALGPTAGVEDVLQSTNMDLWAKRHEYDANRPFLPWAFRFAHFRVLGYRKEQARSRLLFDNTLIDVVHTRFVQTAQCLSNHQQALEHCISKLKPEQVRLLHRRYQRGLSLANIALEESKTPGSIAKRLFRIRRALHDCIQNFIARET